MLQSLILLLYCTGWVAAGSGDIVDHCNYTASSSQTRCGDVCIAFNVSCICGGEQERLFTNNGPKHCCVDDSPEQCNIESDGEGNCPNGRVLNKTQTCNDQCFNDYKASEVIGFDSQFRCGNTACVPVWLMCRGYSMCEDKSDVRACDEKLTCVVDRGPSDKRNMEAGISSNHFYCDYEKYKNDGIYNTITRKDEDRLDIGEQKVNIDFSSLVIECPDRHGDTWFKCGGDCRPNYAWCRKDVSHECNATGIHGSQPFTTNNRALCSNATVWINKTCELFNENRELASEGRRCTGEAQQCYFPWYLTASDYYEVSEQPNIESFYFDTS